MIDAKEKARREAALANMSESNNRALGAMQYLNEHFEYMESKQKSDEVAAQQNVSVQLTHDELRALHSVSNSRACRECDSESKAYKLWWGIEEKLSDALKQ
jgi:hypothetical protein